MNCLMAYDWPGSVRELENCIERAIALGNHQTIDIADLPLGIRAAAGVATPAPLTVAADATDLEDIERATIERVFAQCNGDKVQAGKRLGISRATLYRKLKRYGIGDAASPAEFNAPKAKTASAGGQGSAGGAA